MRIKLIFMPPLLCLLGLLLVSLVTVATAPAQPISDDSLWEESIAAFAAADRKELPPSGGVVFVGSSSIRLWSDLETQLSGARGIINRGFGGAKLSDCTRYLDRVVFPYTPRVIVVYAGDNDLAEGREPKEVFNELVRFVEKVRKILPDTRIKYISIKPSPARAGLLPKIRETNNLIRKFAASGTPLDFIDVFAPMLDPAGQPRRELFRADALHLNSAGYELWASIIAPHVR
jgi:lysophospholipase L1-like esterase